MSAPFHHVAQRLLRLLLPPLLPRLPLWPRRPLLPLMVIAGLTQPAAAQHADTLGGIVVSRTVTVGGQEFSQHFLSAWRDKPGSEHYLLTIVERPSARWGSEVWVEYAQRRVLHLRLPTMRAALRQAGERAAETAFDAILQTERQRKLGGDADLAPDEF